MKISNSFPLPISEIIILREERQRTVIEVESDGLLESIRARGVLNPLILDANKTLIAGERRLTAAKKAGFTHVPVRFIEDLSPLESQIIELEENLKRKDLSWQDQTRAVEKLHSMYQKTEESWSMVKTAAALGISSGMLTRYIRVAKDLALPQIAKAQGVEAAYNMLSRVDERKIGDALSDIATAGHSLFGPAKEPTVTITNPSPSGETKLPVSQQPTVKEPPKAPEIPILNADFTKWVETYEGPVFNFVHCDFPYGINFNGGALSGKDKWVTYKDSPDVYWKLISTLCQNLDKILAPSGHLMFWFSMEHYAETLKVFAEQAPSLIFQKFPLIWLKSDNVGILPDPKRGPRRIYETAFIASREDRFIIKAVSNAYAAPTNKDHHPSTKPEPVLRHFFQMFVDDNSTVFDPTCGSATSLRAAESLGAHKVLGLELDKEHHANAVSAFKQFRTLRRASK